jgi:predicted AlkP superfamily pyrophosphatase or phosphodiesterase
MCLSSLHKYVDELFSGSKERLPAPLSALENARNVVLVIVDGMGYMNMKKKLRELPFFQSLYDENRILPATSVFPSTTAASLASIYLGLDPISHGLLEWYLFLDEAGIIVETLPFIAHNPAEREGFKRLRLQIDVLFEGTAVTESLARKGVECHALLPEAVAESEFSKQMMKKSSRTGYSKLEDVPSLLSDILSRGRRTFVTIYYPGVDTAGHIHGPSSEEYLEEMKKVDRFVSEIARVKRNDTTMLITADHGQIDVDPGKTLYLNDFDWFDKLLSPNPVGGIIHPYGSPRDVIIRTPYPKKMQTKLEEELAEYGDVVNTRHLTMNEYFGKGDMAGCFTSRAGDLWILPGTGRAVWYRHYDDEKISFKGLHGGLTPEEILVPISIT